METNNTYSTKDLDTATVLLYTGYELDRGEVSDDRRTVYFIFKGNPNMSGVLSDFYAGRLSVEPQEFLQKQRQLKNIVYSLKGGQR